MTSVTRAADARSIITDGAVRNRRGEDYNNLKTRLRDELRKYGDVPTDGEPLNSKQTKFGKTFMKGELTMFERALASKEYTEAGKDYTYTQDTVRKHKQALTTFLGEICRLKPEDAYCLIYGSYPKGTLEGRNVFVRGYMFIEDTIVHWVDATMEAAVVKARQLLGRNHTEVRDGIKPKVLTDRAVVHSKTADQSALMKDPNRPSSPRRSPPNPPAQQTANVPSLQISIDLAPRGSGSTPQPSPPSSLPSTPASTTATASALAFSAFRPNLDRRPSIPLPDPSSRPPVPARPNMNFSFIRNMTLVSPGGGSPMPSSRTFDNAAASLTPSEPASPQPAADEPDTPPPVAATSIAAALRSPPSGDGPPTGRRRQKLARGMSTPNAGEFVDERKLSAARKMMRVESAVRNNGCCQCVTTCCEKASTCCDLVKYGWNYWAPKDVKEGFEEEIDETIQDKLKVAKEEVKKVKERPCKTLTRYALRGGMFIGGAYLLNKIGAIATVLKVIGLGGGHGSD